MRSLVLVALLGAFTLLGVGLLRASSQLSPADSTTPPVVDSVDPPGLLEAPNASPESTATGNAGMLVASLTIFVLAIFVGFEVITKVPPTLHTPLMSGSNAISGITIVGALLVTGTASGLASWVAAVAVVLAAVNVVGGFLVTHRMLSMFQKR